jgi:hypothetical protein
VRHRSLRNHQIIKKPLAARAGQQDGRNRAALRSGGPARQISSAAVTRWHEPTPTGTNRYADGTHHATALETPGNTWSARIHRIRHKETVGSNPAIAAQQQQRTSR